MRTRMVAVGFALIMALALVTGSVLLVGYAAATASLLIIVALLVRKVIRGRTASPIQSLAPRWVNSADHEAA